MYLIVVGVGDIGTPLVKLATESGNEVVVIERDEERAERASRAYDCLVINDDATSKETLRDAGADRADALISTTDQDATNIMVCLLAQELSVPNIVSVVHNPEHMNVFEQIGVNTMQNPQSLIAEYLYRAVSRPSVVDFMHIGEEAEVFEITVGADAPIAGKTLREADEADLIGGQTLIVAVEREGEDTPITPRGSTRIEAGDLLTVYSGSGVTPEVTDVFGHPEDHD
ncbi:potassium channel family protein [Halorubrum lipolyticum]|uniref:Trk potassium uptake system protein n=1 Tax=Halorubrum lipolyticum DSM 21995 TaxID=1227482 RepID=M0P1C5_9EURY|nr:TrkA family potassium uptake protein [Halorubrum lipolyticum]EMA63344.1 Trk potassium uptake system protein [Halorubrum lipolyticum DSM 21995]